MRRHVRGLSMNSEYTFGESEKQIHAFSIFRNAEASLVHLKVSPRIDKHKKRQKNN